MRFYCQFSNVPPRDLGEGGFPPSIVDDRDAEPISSIVARMQRGQFVPSRKGYYDIDADGDDVERLADNVPDFSDFDLTDLPRSAGDDFPANPSPANPGPANLSPANPGPANPSPANPGPANPGPAN